jgi:hypothetical protein
MHGGAGVAIMLGPVGDTIIAGLDLHACRDTKTGEVAPWAQAVVGRFQSCTEISPSETGAKLFFTVPAVELPAVEEMFGGKFGRAFKNGGGEHPPAIEVFGPGSYLAVTGKA